MKRSSVLTLPVTPIPPWWRGNPKAPPPTLIGYCPRCDRPVTDLSGSPRDYRPRNGNKLVERAHLVSLVPCGHWVTPEDADDMGRY